MDDEGRNRAQLKHAGIEAVVERFVRRRLYDGLEQNGNWPQPSLGNGCALWLWWMFTTRESLLRETKEEKEDIIRLVFPYMANTARYAAALAPPTHFTLPLGPSNPVQRHLYTSQTPHGTYPLYPTLATPPSTPISSSPASTISHPAPNRPSVLYYFHTSPSFEPLLPATRSDIPVNERGVREGLTREDLEEFNRHKTAKLRGDVEWDWDLGYAVLRSLQPDGTLTKMPVKEGEEPSREWDLDVARARLWRHLQKAPKWRAGSVYRRGLLTGVWAESSSQ
ncbi:hypothetical protein FA13DRAFT_1804626 [Coprinellus micaceus]|uniref:Uncharacterized protein n=1 Tax=Coprinellus micaceus TaxID=71717 RepID=A0A4Y7S6A0_COPMI|nr:hypothetical protein FA13DRAFT_1804626 [Coprinellus micaceus]